ncbi:putative protein kinase [Blattamonas nauphoetae]|uniref:Protein kinase domain-containing protein n=1 Tax=Blattamonas nauphoetae TaxID=2049346 RepID=A0ABQ9XE01_9EUKA|nr:putative protein kinase [Blattamonas nauphoetae]
MKTSSRLRTLTIQPPVRENRIDNPLTPNPNLTPNGFQKSKNSVQALSDALYTCDECDLPYSLPTTPVPFESLEPVGQGTFGTVFVGTFPPQHNIQGIPTDRVAVKRVVIDPTFKNRELQMMKVIDHPNCVKMHRYFYERSNHGKSVLNVLMEYLPESLFAAIRHQTKQQKKINSHLLTLFTYQMLRGTAYLHGLGIVHRDIKPQNILVNVKTGVLKVCDFGSAKVIRPGDSSVSYICSRFYRAPELLVGAEKYNEKIDVWSLACVVCEMLLGRPLFMGDDNDEQFFKIVRCFGLPTPSQFKSMLHSDDLSDLSHLFASPSLQKGVGLASLLPSDIDSNLLDLLQKMMEYDPAKRIGAFDALFHPFFSHLSDIQSPINESHTPPSNRPTPALFNFTPEEIEMYGDKCTKLWSAHQTSCMSPATPASQNTLSSASFNICTPTDPAYPLSPAFLHSTDEKGNEERTSPKRPQRLNSVRTANHRSASSALTISDNHPVPAPPPCSPMGPLTQQRQPLQAKNTRLTASRGVTRTATGTDKTASSRFTAVQPKRSIVTVGQTKKKTVTRAMTVLPSTKK